MKVEHSIQFPTINFVDLWNKNIAVLEQYTHFEDLPWYYYVCFLVAIILLFYIWFDYNYYSVE